jgi:hypothetical protein
MSYVNRDPGGGDVPLLQSCSVRDQISMFCYLQQRATKFFY